MSVTARLHPGLKQIQCSMALPVLSVDTNLLIQIQTEHCLLTRFNTASTAQAVAIAALVFNEGD